MGISRQQRRAKEREAAKKKRAQKPKSPNRSSVPSSEPTTSPRFTWTKFLDLPFWRVARITATLFGLMLGVASLILALVPRPTIEQGEPVDPESSISTTFTVRNSTVVPLENVRVSIDVKKFEFSQGIRLRNIFVTPPDWSAMTLEPDEGITTDFATAVGCKGPCPIKAAEIAITVNYQPWFLPFSRTKEFRFVARKRPNANDWIWEERAAADAATYDAPIPPFDTSVVTPSPPVKTFIVFFDFNKSNLTAEAQSVVTDAVKTAKANGFVKVLVTGHTDTVGSDADDRRLSLQRAQSIKDELVRQGMKAQNVRVEGQGFHDLLVPTAPNVPNFQNNRAVITLDAVF